METPATETEVSGQRPLAEAQCYAAWIVHTPSGPVPACGEHARKIQAIMQFMGVYTNCTPAEPGTQCVNCLNEMRHNTELTDRRGAGSVK